MWVGNRRGEQEVNCPQGKRSHPGVSLVRAAGCAFSHWILANTQRVKLPHVIARVARPVAIRAPALPPTSNPVRGIRIATGINALAMTWGNIPGYVCTLSWGEYEVRSVRTVWEAGPYMPRTMCVGNRDAICYGPSGRPVPTRAFPTWQNTYINKSNGRPRFGDGRCFFAKGLKKKRGRKEV